MDLSSQQLGDVIGMVSIVISLCILLATVTGVI